MGDLDIVREEMKKQFAQGVTSVIRNIGQKLLLNHNKEALKKDGVKVPSMCFVTLHSMITLIHLYQK